MANYKKKAKSSRKRNPTVNHGPPDPVNMADGSQSFEVRNKHTCSNEIDNVDVPEANDANVEYLEAPIKSEYDSREYRVMKLANGLTALLISVPSEDKEHNGASCDVCINVGTFSDPPEIPGLAQMSSRAFFKDKDFSKYTRLGFNTIMANVGCEETIVKMIMVREKYLRKALSSFAQIFINPTLSLDIVKEMRQKTELKMNLWTERKNQLYSSFAQAGHPVSKFAAKNRKVLLGLTDDTVYEELIKFRERHYSAHRMTMAIQAQLPLDTLEKYVEEYFSALPSNGLPADDFAEFKGLDPFESMKIRRIYAMQTCYDSAYELTWIIPLMDEDYRFRVHYLYWILGHKGEGSLYSYLEKKNWCRNIFCNSASDDFGNNSLYSMLNLHLVFTQEGQEHTRDLLDAVFSFINMLRREGPQKRIFDEIRQIKERKFRYTHDMDPIYCSETYSQRMHSYPPEHYITGNGVFLEYDANAIKACTDLLTPDRMNIILREPECNWIGSLAYEEWFQNEESKVEIPEEWIQHWRTVEPLPEFHLPKANAFIAEDFPVKIHSDNWSEIWYKFESGNFRIGEGHVNLHYISPIVMTSPENVAMLDLFASILNKRVALILYEKCDIKCDLRPGMKGLWLNVHGFEAVVLPLMIKSTATAISECSKTLSEDFFNSMKQEQLEQYISNLVDPVELAEELKQSIVVSVYWSFVDLHTALSLIGFQQFCKFVKSFVDDIRIQCYVQGNMSKADAITQVESSFTILNRGTANPGSVLSHGISEIPQGVHCCRVQTFGRLPSNSAVTNYYQFEEPSFRLATMINVLSTVMQKFSLNNKCQKHYMVRGIYGIFGYSITGVDRKASVENIDENIEAFRKLFKNTFKKMSKKQLQSMKAELALRKGQECASVEMDLEIKVNANWIEIMSEKYVFDRRARELEIINEMSIEELRSWMIKFGMGESDGRFRKLSIQVLGYDDETKNIANRIREKRIGNLKKDFPNIYKLNEYKLKYLESRPEDKRNLIRDSFITDLNDYKRGLNTMPFH